MGRRPLDPVALLAKEPIGITRYGKCMYEVTDWVARLEKLEQAPAAKSDSGLLVQSAWIEKNVPDVCAPPPIRWSGKYRPASVSGSPPTRGREIGPLLPGGGANLRTFAVLGGGV